MIYIKEEAAAEFESAFAAFAQQLNVGLIMLPSQLAVAQRDRTKGKKPADLPVQ